MMDTLVANIDAAVRVVTTAVQSVGLELMIFIVTMVAALIFRHGKHVTKRRIAKAQSKVLGDEFFDKQVAQPMPTPTPQGDATWGELQRVVQGFAATSAPQKAATNGRPLARPEELPDMINEIVEGMREQPGVRFANRALDIYTELRQTLRAEPSLRITSIARRSRYCPIDLYTVLVQCAVRATQVHLIDSIVADMVQQGVPRPIVFYESAMKQLAGQKHYHLALAMYDRLTADGLEPSAVTLSCLINFAEELGELDRAILFFDRLCALTTPSIRACMKVLRVHNKRQDWQAALSTLETMRSHGVSIDSLALNVVLATGVAADRMEGVEQMLVNYEKTADVVSFNTVIKGYAQRNDTHGARSVVNRMRNRGLQPNAITFNTVMDAAVRSGKSDDAWQLLAEMRSAGIAADKFTCSILVKGLAKAATSDSADRTALKDQVRIALSLLKEVGATFDMTLAGSLHHAVLEAAAQIPDSTLVMQAFSQMRQCKVAPSDAAMRRIGELVRSKDLVPAAEAAAACAA